MEKLQMGSVKIISKVLNKREFYNYNCIRIHFNNKVWNHACLCSSDLFYGYRAEVVTMHFDWELQVIYITHYAVIAGSFINEFSNENGDNYKKVPAMNMIDFSTSRSKQIFTSEQFTSSHEYKSVFNGVIISVPLLHSDAIDER